MTEDARCADVSRRTLSSVTPPELSGDFDPDHRTPTVPVLARDVEHHSKAGPPPWHVRTALSPRCTPSGTQRVHAIGPVGMEKVLDTARQRIDPAQIWAFVKAASLACEREIFSGSLSDEPPGSGIDHWPEIWSSRRRAFKFRIEIKSAALMSASYSVRSPELRAPSFARCPRISRRACTG